jgi:ribosomal protein S18 acetylase RimI-like enzyme
VQDDREAVVALWKEADLTRDWNNPLRDFDLAIGGPLSTILLARDGEELIGTAMVGFDGHRGWVYYLATKSDRRGMGVGRGLMKQAEEWLRDRGAPKIQLMVREDNRAACSFYEAIGYDVQPVVTIGRRLE